MKNNILKSITLLSMAVGTLTSCNDYLTKENPNQTTNDTFWQTLSDTQSGLYATYATLRNDFVLNLREEGWRSDMAWPGYGRPAPEKNDDGWQWYTQSYNNTTVSISKKWNALYKGVWRANQVIIALENNFDYENLSEKDQEKWDYQMGQAKFMRGLMYFYLSSAFNEGSVVLRETIPGNMKEYNKGLSSAEDVLEFYRADLEEAYELLPAVCPTGDDFAGLPTRGAAATILGTSYIYKGDYEKAKEYFEDVITNTEYGYALETDLSKMFTTAGEFNSESILEVVYSLDKRQDIDTWDQNCMYNRLGTMTTSTVGCLLPSWLVWEYNQEEMDPLVAANYIKGVATGVATDMRPVSLRASSMVALANDWITPYYVSTNAPLSQNIFGGPRAEWGFGKYKKYSNSDLSEEVGLMSGKNVVVNRLSDVYLLYAECLLDEGDVQGALDYINAIRARWGLVLRGESASGNISGRTYDEVSYSAEEVLELIQQIERPLELSFEGHQLRWQDLLRWGLLDDNDKNIFKTHAEKVFYSYGSGVNNLDGTYEKFSSNVLVTDNAALKDEASQTIDYEYVKASEGYKKADKAYFPIPSSETMNNSSIK